MVRCSIPACQRSILCSHSAPQPGCVLLRSHQLTAPCASGPQLPRAAESVLRSMYLKMVVAIMEKLSGLRSEEDSGVLWQGRGS